MGNTLQRVASGLANIVLVKRRLNRKTVMEKKANLEVRYSKGKSIQSKYSSLSGTKLFQGLVGVCLALGLALVLYIGTLQLPFSPQSVEERPLGKCFSHRNCFQSSTLRYDVKHLVRNESLQNKFLSF